MYDNLAAKIAANDQSNTDEPLFELTGLHAALAEVVFQSLMGKMSPPRGSPFTVRVGDGGVLGNPEACLKLLQPFARTLSRYVVGRALSQISISSYRADRRKQIRLRGVVHTAYELHLPTFWAWVQKTHPDEMTEDQLVALVTGPVKFV